MAGRSIVAEQLASAWARRAGLHHDVDTNAYRLFHGWSEGIPGLTVDRYGEVVLITHRTEHESLLDEVVQVLLELAPGQRVIARTRRPPPRALVGGSVQEPTVVLEAGLRYVIEPWRRSNPGLYLDARNIRAWIREHARERRILNLFAFAGSLGVSALAGGAREVIQVDSNAAALAHCRRNHELNAQPVDERNFMRVNVYQHMRRAAMRRQRFDGVIVDPPPLDDRALKSDRTPGGRGIFGLAPRVLPLLTPGGWALFFVHYRDKSRGDAEQRLLASSDVPVNVVWRGSSGCDFPDPEDRRLQVIVVERQ